MRDLKVATPERLLIYNGNAPFEKCRTSSTDRRFITRWLCYPGIAMTIKGNSPGLYRWQPVSMVPHGSDAELQGEPDTHQQLQQYNFPDATGSSENENPFSSKYV